MRDAFGGVGGNTPEGLSPACEDWNPETISITFGLLILSPTSSLRSVSSKRNQARVAELADALDLGSSAARCGGSTPPSRTFLLLPHWGQAPLGILILVDAQESKHELLSWNMAC